MGYVDFLEAFVRITLAYPFTDEEKIDLDSFESQLKFLLQKLDSKFKDQKNQFERRMTLQQGENQKFQPRVVVDEDDDDYEMNWQIIHNIQL